MDDPTFNFRKLQNEVSTWSKKNFGEQAYIMPLMGMVEELGELHHGILKQLQGIRGDEDHEQQIADAIGDLLIYTADFCARRGLDLQIIITNTWEKVKKRDWKKNPNAAHSQEPTPA